MKFEFKKSEGGAQFTLIMETDQVNFTPGEVARIEHYMPLVLNSASQRYIRHVLPWEERKAVLLKLSLRDATILDLKKEWLEAQEQQKKHKEQKKAAKHVPPPTPLA